MVGWSIRWSPLFWIACLERTNSLAIAQFAPCSVSLSHSRIRILPCRTHACHACHASSSLTLCMLSVLFSSSFLRQASGTRLWITRSARFWGAYVDRNDPGGFLVHQMKQAHGISGPGGCLCPACPAQKVTQACQRARSSRSPRVFGGVGRGGTAPDGSVSTLATEYLQEEWSFRKIDLNHAKFSYSVALETNVVAGQKGFCGPG